MEPKENEFPKHRSSCNGTEVGYTVEARYNNNKPVKIGDQIFDNRWVEVEFVDSKVGIPRCPSYQLRVIECNLLGYAAAQTLRWWLHAIANADHSFYGACLETRILCHHICYSYEVKTVSVHCHIHGDNRSNLFPDYEKDFS